MQLLVHFLHSWALICLNFWANPLVNNNSKTKTLSHINLVGLIRNKREKARLVIISIIIIIMMINYSTFLQHKLNYKAGVVDMHSQKRLCLLRLPFFLERFPITQILFHFEFSFWKSWTKQCNAQESCLTLHPLQMSNEQ